MHARDTFCSFCGTRFGGRSYPRECGNCGQITYRNPLPVAVAIVPVDGGVIAIRRGIDPQKGQLALPGGYIEFGESWQEAAARELLEETRIRVGAELIEQFLVRSAPDGKVLVFGLAPPVPATVLESWVATPEALELVVIREPLELAFQLHTEALRRYFAESS